METTFNPLTTALQLVSSFSRPSLSTFQSDQWVNVDPQVALVVKTFVDCLDHREILSRLEHAQSLNDLKAILFVDTYLSRVEQPILRQQISEMLADSDIPLAVIQDFVSLAMVRGAVWQHTAESEIDPNPLSHILYLVDSAAQQLNYEPAKLAAEIANGKVHADIYITRQEIERILSDSTGLHPDNLRQIWKISVERLLQKWQSPLSSIQPGRLRAGKPYQGSLLSRMEAVIKFLFAGLGFFLGLTLVSCFMFVTIRSIAILIQWPYPIKDVLGFISKPQWNSILGIVVLCALAFLSPYLFGIPIVWGIALIKKAEKYFSARRLREGGENNEPSQMRPNFRNPGWKFWSGIIISITFCFSLAGIFLLLLGICVLDSFFCFYIFRLFGVNWFYVAIGFVVAGFVFIWRMWENKLFGTVEYIHLLEEGQSILSAFGAALENQFGGE